MSWPLVVLSYVASEIWLHEQPHCTVQESLANA